MSGARAGVAVADQDAHLHPDNQERRGEEPENE